MVAILANLRAWCDSPAKNLIQLPLDLLRTDNEMDHAVWRGEKEAVEILAQLLDLIAPRDAVHFQKRGGCFGVVGFQFQPDIGMT